MIRPADDAIWGSDDHQLVRVARNVATRYLAIVTDALIGLLILPFNVHHLGAAAYGLWMLTASVTVYFSVLDLGFGGSITKFVAQYRARRDARSLNEIASTLFMVFLAIGAAAYLVFIALAFNVQHLFNIAPDQAPTARALMLIIGLHVAATFPFSVFGGIINGFQRYDLNSGVGIASSIVVAIVNVAMVLSGFTLVQLVLATTSIRLTTYVVYRWNAYKVFPALSVRPSLFRWMRIREVSTFSVYVSGIDWAQKLNYSADAIIIGAFMSSTAVAIWTVPQRLAEVLQRLTNQVNGVLFPVVVDSDAGARPDRLRTIFIQGTRISLLTVAPLATALFVLAERLIHAWVGARFEDAIPVAQILMLVVVIRVGNSSATTVLKGAGRHRFLAMSNLAMALANVALSLLWIRRYGLIGQAMGTLVPVALVSTLVLWPAACRRVGVPIASAIRQAVWPTLWPAVVMAVVLVALRGALPDRLWAVAAASAAGVLCYVATFLLFAVRREERRLFLSKAGELARAHRRIPAAA